MKVEAYTPNLFRIRISPTGEFPQTLMERYGIIKTDWPDADGQGCTLPLKYPAALYLLRLRFAQTGTGSSPEGSSYWPQAAQRNPGRKKEVRRSVATEQIPLLKRIQQSQFAVSN